jgi:hypothetical protein
MTGESGRHSGHADETEATHALPGGTFTREFAGLLRHGLQRLLALDEPAAPLLVDQGDGAPRWFQRHEWRVFSPETVAAERIGRTMARFQLDNGDEAVLAHDSSSGKLTTPMCLRLRLRPLASGSSHRGN